MQLKGNEHLSSVSGKQQGVAGTLAGSRACAPPHLLPGPCSVSLPSEGGAGGRKRLAFSEVINLDFYMKFSDLDLSVCSVIKTFLSAKRNTSA